MLPESARGPYGEVLVEERAQAATALTEGRQDGRRLGSPLCPACGEPLTSSRARFCEACGAEMDPAATGSLPFRPTAAPAPAPAGTACRHCNGQVGACGYCDTCGLAALEPVAVDERGSMAVATHRGRRHARNEDAAALAITGEGWPVLVVADGVSRSTNPHLAASGAVHAAAEWLEGRPFTGTGSLAGAVAAAQRAVRDVGHVDDPARSTGDTRAACTLVVAVATDRDVHVANVGDTRAYLLQACASTSGATDANETPGTWTVTQLTVDDSVGHALTAWLGTDAPDPPIHLTTRPAAPGDVLLACSDGLWNYAPDGPALGRLTGETLGPPPTAVPTPVPLPVPEIPPEHPSVSPAEACARLVSWAIDRGGADNISVALARIPVLAAGQAPAASTSDRSRREEQHDHQ